MYKRLLYFVAAGTVLSFASGALANEADFSACMKRTLTKFGISSLGVDLPGALGAIDARRDCYSFLEPSDPSYKTVMKDLENWDRIHRIAIRHRGMNI